MVESYFAEDLLDDYLYYLSESYNIIKSILKNLPVYSEIIYDNNLINKKLLP